MRGGWVVLCCGDECDEREVMCICKMLERLVTLCLLLKRLKTGRGKIKVVCCSVPNILRVYY